MRIEGAIVEIQGERYVLATRGQRLIAQILDGVVYGVIGVVGLVLGSVTFGVMAAVGGIAAAAYLLLQDGLAGGQSYAKRWIGVQVLDARTGRTCSFGKSFLRNLLLLILGIIDWVFIFGGARQRLGDKAAGTVVVQAGGPRATF